MSTDNNTPSTALLEVLTPDQASALLQVPAATLQVWRSTGRVALPFCKVGGHVRYRQQDIAEFLERNTLGRASAPPCNQTRKD